VFDLGQSLQRRSAGRRSFKLTTQRTALQLFDDLVIRAVNRDEEVEASWAARPGI
jgi:hypothetical protein